MTLVRSWRRPWQPRVLIVVSIAMLLAACTSGPGATPTLPPPEQLRDQAVETLLALTSVHFEVSHAEGGTDIGGGLLLTKVVGDASFPGRASMRADGEVARVVVGFGIVQIDDVTYFSGPFGDTWRTVEPGALPFDFVAMNRSVGDALASAIDLSVDDGGAIDGQPMFALSGTITSDSLRGLVPGATPGLSLGLTAWIGQEDHLPWRVKLVGPLIDADPAEMTRFLDLSGFGKDVTIEPPL